MSRAWLPLLRLIACLSGVAILVFALGVYAEYIAYLGFPDGYVTPLGAAERPLAAVFVAISVPVGLSLFYLGSFSNQARLPGRLVVTLGGYLLIVCVTVGIDLYYQSHLMGGGGG